MVVLTEHQLLHAARCVVDDHQLTDRDRAFNPPAAVPHQRGAHRSWGRGVVPAVGAWWRARATACDVFQVVMVPWCFAVITALFALGGGWAAREETGRGSQAIKLCSDRSFGVFLMHPVLLLVWMLDPAGWLSSRMPALWSTMLAFTAVVSASLLVVELFRRSPISLVLTGKRRSRAEAPVHSGRAEPSLAAEPVWLGAGRT